MYEEGISHLNIGTGEDLTIRELARVTSDIIGFHGLLEFDNHMPDRTPRKLLDVTRLYNLGWKHKTSLIEGIKKTYQWFLDNGPN